MLQLLCKSSYVEVFSLNSLVLAVIMLALWITFWIHIMLHTVYHVVILVATLEISFVCIPVEPFFNK